VAAFERILKDHPDLSLVLVGRQSWPSERADIPPAHEGLLHLESVTDDQLAVLYSGCAVFTYLSLYEGFGLPVLEAMACGAPVVVSDRSSLPEVVGDAGIVVDPHDIEDVEKGIRAALDRGPADLGIKSRRQAETFHWSTMADGVVDALRGVATKV
jgi:glycosyltransferase involved in cell wall biosynthesis